MSSGGSSQVCQRSLPSSARSLDKVRQRGEEENHMEYNRLGFIIRATYDVLPSPTNLHIGVGEDPACLQCAAPASLKHILVGCNTSLIQGRYMWCHNQVLKCLATEYGNKRVTNKVMPSNAQATVIQLAT